MYLYLVNLFFSFNYTIHCSVTWVSCEWWQWFLNKVYNKVCFTSGYFTNVGVSLFMNKCFKNLRYVVSKLWRNIDLSFWYSVDRRTLAVNDFFYNKYRYPYCSKYQKLVSFLRSNCFFFVNPVREASMFLFKYERH